MTHSLREEFLPLSDNYNYEDLFNITRPVDTFCDLDLPKKITFSILKKMIYEADKISDTSDRLPSYQDCVSLLPVSSNEQSSFAKIDLSDISDQTKDLIMFLHDAHVMMLNDSVPELVDKSGDRTLIEAHHTRVLLDTSTRANPGRLLPITLCSPRIRQLRSRDLLQALRIKYSDERSVDLNESLLINASVPIPLLRGVRSPDFLVSRLYGL
jgi:hypothetical protein